MALSSVGRTMTLEQAVLGSSANSTRPNLT